MKFQFFALLAVVAFATESQAAWCCCNGEDEGSINCCQKIKGKVTFWSSKCGIMNGQTCDLGSSASDQERYKECCKYEDGFQGRCF